jgi:hypothetical protein
MTWHSFSFKNVHQFPFSAFGELFVCLPSKFPLLYLFVMLCFMLPFMRNTLDTKQSRKKNRKSIGWKNFQLLGGKFSKFCPSFVASCLSIPLGDSCKKQGIGLEKGNLIYCALHHCLHSTPKKTINVVSPSKPSLKW